MIFFERILMEKKSNQFLFIIHHSKKSSTKKHWDEYIAFLIKKGHLNGGSSLGKGVGVKNSKKVLPRAKTIGGYIVVSAKTIGIASKLACLCPAHVNGGNIDIFPLVRDK